MNYEQKYKQALAHAREIHRNEVDKRHDMEWLFPELKESEDERIKKELIKHLRDGAEGYMPAGNAEDYTRWLAWLEKQGDIDKVSYEVAEKEKYDFVSGHFIDCKKSFNEFKEDSSYWLEYLGNDTYIGRSDNILNEKFHITPRQLYSLFAQQQYTKEDNTNDETNAPTEYGKYVDECLNEASKHFFSDREDKYSVADLFYAGVRCGKSWLEKQGELKLAWSEEEQNRFAKGVLSSCALSFINYLDAHKYEGKMCVSNGECEDIENAFHNAMWDRLHRYYCKYVEKQGEQKCIDEVEPKFKVGDWITDGQLTCKVLSVTSKSYELHLYNDDYRHFETDVQSVDKHYHLWTIQDAKDGDYLTVNGRPFIYCCNDDYKGNYCCIDSDGTFRTTLDFGFGGKIILPATKEQRNLLFQKMHEAGYEWDAEKKELKKIVQNQNLAWSEEDECYMDECINAIATKDVWSFEEKRKTKHWLKSLKERINYKKGGEK